MKSVRPFPLPTTPTFPLKSSGDLKMLSFFLPCKKRGMFTIDAWLIKSLTILQCTILDNQRDPTTSRLEYHFLSPAWLALPQCRSQASPAASLKQQDGKTKERLHTGWVSQSAAPILRLPLSSKHEPLPVQTRTSSSDRVHRVFVPEFTARRFPATVHAPKLLHNLFA